MMREAALAALVIPENYRVANFEISKGNTDFHLNKSIERKGGEHALPTDGRPRFGSWHYRAGILGVSWRGEQAQSY